MCKSAVIYLASPYSHPDARVRQARFESACRATAALIRNSIVVYSPIAHSHPVATIGGISIGWEIWKGQDLAMLARCDELWVLKLDGWR